MKLNKISADMVSRRPDQTAEWLNRLARQVDIVESEALSGSKKTSDLPIATTYSLGVVKIGQNLSITPEGVLSALAPVSYNYELLFNKPKINNVELIGNKSLHDLGIDIPIKTSELLNDGSDSTSVYVELDELATVATSGSYADLLNKPTIGNATLTIQKNGTSAGTFTANATSNETINITVPTTAADVGALPDSTKYAANLSLTINSSTFVVTGQLKDQDGNNIGNSQTIDLPLESVVVNGSYDSVTKEVVLTLENGNTIRFSVADLVSGLQTEITSNNPLNADLVDDSTSTNKFVTSSDITTWNGKQDALTAGSNIQINGATISATDTTYSAGSGLNLNGTTFSVDTTTIQPKLTAGSNIQINGSTISATDTTYSTFTGASSGTAGTSGLVPAPAAGDDTKYLSGDGLWKTVSQYSLPIATANDLGGIKVGSRLTINSTTGVLSADSQTDNNFTNTLKTKLDGIASGAEVNVQADWNEASSSSDAYIKNKPSLATVATSGSYNDLTNKPTIPAAQVNSDWNANSGVAQILNKPSLATVATSGSYNDLTNKPTISTVNDATLTIQKNGSTVNTFTANASSNVTANITVPTKTSELTNDSGFITNTTTQDFAAQEGSTNPVFDDMTPIKTFTWTVADTTYRPVYQFDNTGWAYDNMDLTVAYRITVTGSGISQVTDIIDRWFSPTSWPVTSIMARTLSTSAATTGYRYLRAVYPNSSGLNNNTYKFGQEISNYNSTSRTIQVDVFKTATGITWNETKPAGTIYTDSTYQATNSMQPYATRGWMFRAPASFNANSADAATRVSSYESATVASSAIKAGAALTSGYIGFQATDGKVYMITNTTANMACDENARIGCITTGYNADAAIDTRYFRSLANLSSTQAGYIPHATMALGDRLYLRCTMDSSGNIHSDNYLATSMSAGYTWLPFGTATSSNTIYMDVRKPSFYTLSANGALTHINGKRIDAPDITVTSTDPGEGSPLGQGEYIAVYGAISDVPNFTLTNVDPGEGSPLGQDDYLAVYGSPNTLPASEIDWSTFQGSASTPVYSSTAFNLGPFSATLRRIGNFCFISGSAVISSWPSGNRVNTGKTLPAGFTPVNESIITCINIDGQYADNVSTLSLETSREIWRSSNHSITSATRIDYSGFWITTDAWPS